MNAPKEVTLVSKTIGVVLIFAAVTAPVSILALLYVFGQVASAIH